MIKGGKKTFLDKSKLYTLVNLRLNGFSVYFLADMFSVDRSAIEYQLDKYRIQKPEQIYNIPSIISRAIVATSPIPLPRFELVDGESICVGRSYKEYLANYSPIKK